MTQVNIPGGERAWCSLLPAPLCDDPEVAVVLVPSGASLQVGQVGDLVAVMVVLEHTRRQRLLQVLVPQRRTREEQEREARGAGVEMVTWAWEGRLSRVPQRLLVHDGMVPLLLLRDQMHRQFVAVGGLFWPGSEGTWN